MGRKRTDLNTAEFKPRSPTSRLRILASDDKQAPFSLVSLFLVPRCCSFLSISPCLWSHPFPPSVSLCPHDIHPLDLIELGPRGHWVSDRVG